jgi:aspartyl aminopeptidase
MDPNFKGAYDKLNTANMGFGPLFHKYTGSRGKSGSNEANPEFLNQVTRMLDKKEIPWQLNVLGKVDGGGGGTIANYLCNLNTDVIDSGVPILGLHSPFELISKVDLYAVCDAYRAFMEEM